MAASSSTGLFERLFGLVNHFPSDEGVLQLEAWVPNNDVGVQAVDDGDGVVGANRTSDEQNHLAEVNEQQQDDDNQVRMELNDQERRWALELKQVVEGSSVPELDNLSDFLYGQLALVEKGNVNRAVERAKILQAFREEYGVLDTLEDGRKSVREFLQLFPRFILSFCLQDENYVFVNNLSGIRPEVLNTPENVNVFFRGAYYCLHCCFPDLESIRQGSIVISECEGFKQLDKRYLRFYRQFWSDLAGAYPVKFKKLKHFHTGVFVNLLFSMSKRLLPQDVRAGIEVGCQFDECLDDVYLTPTLEAAHQRIMRQLGVVLERRYAYVRSFSLSNNEVKTS